jgi:hypothetical protein
VISPAGNQFLPFLVIILQRFVQFVQHGASLIFQYF